MLQLLHLWTTETQEWKQNVKLHIFTVAFFTHISFTSSCAECVSVVFVRFAAYVQKQQDEQKTVLLTETEKSAFSSPKKPMTRFEHATLDTQKYF